LAEMSALNTALSSMVIPKPTKRPWATGESSIRCGKPL
jgi:hypothetical protein